MPYLINGGIIVTEKIGRHDYQLIIKCIHDIDTLAYHNNKFLISRGLEDCKLFCDMYDNERRLYGLFNDLIDERYWHV